MCQMNNLLVQSYFALHIVIKCPRNRALFQIPDCITVRPKKKSLPKLKMEHELGIKVK